MACCHAEASTAHVHLRLLASARPAVCCRDVLEVVYANKAQKLRFGEPCSEAETQARLNLMPEAERVNRRKLARDAMQSSASFKRGWVDGQRLFSLTNKGVASHESFVCLMYKASTAVA